MFQENPLDIKTLGTLDITAFKDELKEITDIIQEYDDARASWVQDCKDIKKLIDGSDERKNKPWKHASDLCVPLIKRMIRRWKPVLYNLVALADPVCSFYAGTAQTTGDAPTAERFFDWLVKIHMDGALDEIQYLLDYIGSYGSGYMGVSWDYKSELQSRVASVKTIFPEGVPEDPNIIIQTLASQYEINVIVPEARRRLEVVAREIQENQAQYVRVVSRQTIKKKPKITAYKPMDVILPPHSKETHEADCVVLVSGMTPCELRQKARDGFFIPEAVEKRLTKEQGKGNHAGNKLRGDNTGQTNNETGQEFDNENLRDKGVSHTPDDIAVHQIYCKLDYNGDGIKERVVLWVAPQGSTPIVLALFPFSLSIPHWPVFRFDFEKSSKGPYTSQGIGNMLDAIQKQLNKQFRARSDAIDIQLAPVFQNRITNGIRGRNIRWSPGKIGRTQRVSRLQTRPEA